MKKFLVFVLVWNLVKFSNIYSCNIADGSSIESQYFCPAEFEKIDAIWIAFSRESAKTGFPYMDAQFEVIENLAPNTVNILFKTPEDLKFFLSLSSQREIDISHCELLIEPFETIWLRDISPVFIKEKNSSQLRGVQFGFNEWGYAEKEVENAAHPSLDGQLCQAILDLLKISTEKSIMTSESGNHEVNGKGTLICVEAVEKDRNPQLKREEMEKSLKESLKVEKVIWIPFGLVEDGTADTTYLLNTQNIPFYYTPFTPGGHIDEFCRFIDENTLLLMEVVPTEDELHPIERENAKRLDQIYAILQKETDQDGQPFKIIRIPSPILMFDHFSQGDSFYTFFKDFKFKPTDSFPRGSFPRQSEYHIIPSLSYLNFLICNDCVLIPKYWKEGRSENIRIRDLQVMDIFKKVFPNKRIRSIDVYNLNLAGGGIHCMTQFQPE